MERERELQQGRNKVFSRGKRHTFEGPFASEVEVSCIERLVEESAVWEESERTKNGRYVSWCFLFVGIAFDSAHTLRDTEQYSTVQGRRLLPPMRVRKSGSGHVVGPIFSGVCGGSGLRGLPPILPILIDNRVPF